jgi:hypothetical protein
MCFIGGMSANAFSNYKGLRIKPSEKHEVIPTWDEGERYSVAETLARKPIGFNADGYVSLRQEGLGVSHEEWMKSKGM